MFGLINPMRVCDNHGVGAAQKIFHYVDYLLMSQTKILVVVVNNNENFGFVDEELKIVDFQVHEELFQENMVSRFQKNFVSLINAIGDRYLFKIDSDERKSWDQNVLNIL